VQQNDSVESANAKLIEALKDINISLQVPTLEAFGADKQYFDEVVNTMAEQALASGSPSNNPSSNQRRNRKTLSAIMVLIFNQNKSGDINEYNRTFY
jgi:alcohol dehydrogenase class IV